MTLIEYFKEYLKQKLSFKISTFWLFMEGGGHPFKTLKVALGRMFCAEIRGKNIYFFFTYLITLCKDVTFPLITKFKTNKYSSYLSVNRIPN